MMTEKRLMIRKVKESDFEQWLVLWNAYNHFYGRHGKNTLDFDITKFTWERFNDVNEPVFALVAEIDGYIVGIANSLYHASTISIGPNCYLQDLYTSESARAKGVAYDPDHRSPALRIDLESIEVHRVESVRFKTKVHKVYKSRYEDWKSYGKVTDD